MRSTKIDSGSGHRANKPATSNIIGIIGKTHSHVIYTRTCFANSAKLFQCVCSLFTVYVRSWWWGDVMCWQPNMTTRPVTLSDVGNKPHGSTSDYNATKPIKQGLSSTKNCWRPGRYLIEMNILNRFAHLDKRDVHRSNIQFLML